MYKEVIELGFLGKSKEDDKRYRVEKHFIYENNQHYKMLDDFCFMSKNIYNFANYIIRKDYFGRDDVFKYLPYTKIDAMLKEDGLDFDYRNMPTAQTAQQTLRLLDNNWKAYKESLYDWMKNPSKYNGRPKVPKFLKKDGRFPVILTNQNCRVRKDGTVKFPKVFDGFTVHTRVKNIVQVRILPRNNHLIVEVVYKVELPEIKVDNNKFVSIDLGVDNLATLTNNVGVIPVVISGKNAKSINQYYNKQLAHYRSVSKRMNNANWTRKMDKITLKRNLKIDDNFHKASKSIVQYALSCGANTIVIGNNKGWKKNSKMNKKANQKFTYLPYKKLIDMIIYKSNEKGISVILTEESYTSGTSFLDRELPNKESYNKKRRVQRGLFISNSGLKINADVNGSYQIMKKVFPNAFSNGIEDAGLHPIRVTV